MQRIVDLVLKERLLVLLGIVLLIGGGFFAFKNISIDAFPDVTNVQIQIIS